MHQPWICRCSAPNTLRSHQAVHRWDASSWMRLLAFSLLGPFSAKMNTRSRRSMLWDKKIQKCGKPTPNTLSSTELSESGEVGMATIGILSPVSHMPTYLGYAFMPQRFVLATNKPNNCAWCVQPITRRRAIAPLSDNQLVDSNGGATSAKHLNSSAGVTPAKWWRKSQRIWAVG